MAFSVSHPFTRRWPETTETKILVSVQSEEENDENNNDSYVYSEKREDNAKQRLEFLWHILRQGSEGRKKNSKVSHVFVGSREDNIQ